MTHLSSMGTEAPVLGTLPDLALCSSSSSCSPVAFIASFNKLGTVSKCFPESREPRSLTRQGVVETLDLKPGVRGTCDNLGLQMRRLEGDGPAWGLQSPGGYPAGVPFPGSPVSEAL